MWWLPKRGLLNMDCRWLPWVQTWSTDEMERIEELGICRFEDFFMEDEEKGVQIKNNIFKKILNEKLERNKRGEFCKVLATFLFIAKNI